MNQHCARTGVMRRGVERYDMTPKEAKLKRALGNKARNHTIGHQLCRVGSHPVELPGGCRPVTSGAPRKG